MIKLSLLLAVSLSLFAQQDWQGDVKKTYPLTLPAFQGTKPVFSQAAKTNDMPQIEMYSVTTALANLKTSADFYRASLEQQGFKQVKANVTDQVAKIEMLNAGRKLTAVVVCQKQSAKTMLLGVSVMPQGTLKH
ncbi:MAG: hypothetical protein K2X03_15850 [Bryobacteraceae bacterium]|nr:hypothetical protein [Bryobacteraceae bacterium]